METQVQTLYIEDGRGDSEMKICSLMHIYSSSKTQICFQESSQNPKQGWAPPLDSH